jgi:hypothetical protein
MKNRKILTGRQQKYWENNLSRFCLVLNNEKEKDTDRETNKVLGKQPVQVLPCSK